MRLEALRRQVVFAMLLLGVAALFAWAAPAQANVGEEASRHAAEPTAESYVSNPYRPELANDQILVAFRNGVNALAVQQLVGRYGSTVEKVLPLASRRSGQKIALIQPKPSATATVLEQLKNNPAVTMASLNYMEGVAATVPNDPAFAELWGLNNTTQSGGTDDADIDAPEAWDVGTGSAGVVVADIDTGIDYTHEDLAANIWTNAGETAGDGIDNDGNGYIDDVFGIDTAYWDSDPWDDHGHGTHTAGTIAAVGDNGVGIAGVAWSTQVMGVKFLDEWGDGSDAGAIEAIYYVIDQKLTYGVNIVAINASWGGGGYNALLEQAIADAGDAGIVFVAAAGNDSWNTDVMPNYPSGFDVPTIVSVGATDSDDNPSWFTNFGAGTVDLFAPGESIYSTVPGFFYQPAAGDLFFDDMEAGSGRWFTIEGTWAVTDESPQSGTHSWSDSPSGDYVDDTDISIITETIDLTAGPAHPMFGFSLMYELGDAGWDMLAVELSGDDGATWETMTSYLGSSSGSWESASVPIPAHLCTTQFKARFHLLTYSDDGATYDGVYIDDVGIGSASASDTYDWWSGTSMAAPHVTGSLAVLADEYPADTPLERISRVRSSVDVLPQLAGLAGTEGRLNLAAAIDPGLVPSPWVTDLLYERPIGEGSELTVEGVLLGDSTGKVFLSDGVSEVEAPVTFWSDGVVEASMPGTRNAVVVLERADGARVTAGTLSAWADRDPSIMARDGNAALSSGGAIFSFGGYTQGGWLATSMVESYDPGVDMWMAISRLRLPAPRVYAATVELDGCMYVIGGYDDVDEASHDTVWAYDLWSSEWTSLAPLPSPLMFHEAVVVDGLIWVFGGSDESGTMNPDTYVYDPGVDSWTMTTGPATPRIEGAGVAFDGLIYYFGGLSMDTGDYLTDAEVYDPYTDTWSALADLPLPLARMGVTEHGGKMYLSGGTNTDWWLGGTNTLLRFNPATGTWADLSTTVLGLPVVAAVHSSPAVSVEGEGIYSLNGMAWGMSSERLQMLAGGAIDTAIVSLDPAYGPPEGGTEVTITGTNFYGVTDITFGSVPADGFTVDSTTQITAISPAQAAGVVQLQVTAADGPTADTEADDFTYADKPTIVSLDPSGGPAAGGTVVTITGTGFVGLSGPGAVTFGGVPADGSTVDSDTQVTAIAPAHGGGVVQVQVTAAGGATQDVDADDFLYAATYASLRGTDRYDTAIKISRTMFPGALPPDCGLVLAPGDTFQEALCGAPLAAAYGGPVLLTPRSGLNNAVRAEILRLQPEYVIVIGLSDTIQNAVQTGLGSVGTATVIRGTNVYDMSYKVAKALGAKVGDMSGATAIITRGDKFPDAIGIAPLACAQRWPVLLTSSSTALSISAAQAMGELLITKAIKVGTYATLPVGVVGRANLSGADRYQTNVNVAEWAKDNAGLAFGHLGMATGDKFPDALAAGPYLALERGVLLLSPLFGPLPAGVAAEIAANAADIYHVSFMGMIEPVIGQVKALLPSGV